MGHWNGEKNPKRLSKIVMLTFIWELWKERIKPSLKGVSDKTNLHYGIIQQLGCTLNAGAQLDKDIKEIPSNSFLIR